jgi:hypothetical protein
MKVLFAGASGAIGGRLNAKLICHGERRPSSEMEKECGRPVPIKDAAVASVAALTVPPSIHKIVDDFSGILHSDFETGQEHASRETVFGDCMGSSSLIFCKQNCCVNQKKPIHDLNYWSNWK